MIVVSDTSPIINLAMIGHLDLLHQLYGDIVIPSAVGLLGVLLAAKDAGILPAIKGPLDDLIAKAGFWMRPSLYAAVLKAAGE